ncbi:bile acid:sodium symporter family protein [bacterium]|nr:bile acid:sodium symporter family protein [bacterium]
MSLKSVSDFLGKYMALLALGVGAVSLFFPASGLWIKTGWINYLLMAVMFGMGLTLKPEAFILVFKRPGDILLGTAAQFVIMPLLAFFLGKLFRLDTALLTGVVLVGTCPGGTASNVITYLSKGDVALSVGMTSVNTLLAPVLTPFITYLLLKASVSVDVAFMFFSIIKVVIVPIVLGFLINKFFSDFSARAAGFLPLVSVLAILLILACIISRNAERIMNCGAIVFLVVVLHNLLGCLCGYLLGCVFKLPVSKKKTLCIEVGMQNSGLASSLASSAFSGLPMAAVPGALFSVWHNISGAILAGFFRKLKDEGTND